MRRIALLAISITGVACASPDEAAPIGRDLGSAASSSRGTAAAKLQKPLLIKVPADLTDGRAYVTAKHEEHTGRPVILYVGATWCEPCKRIHDALEGGALDRELAGAVFLEYDLDQHLTILGASDLACESKLVPLFARANADGTCGGRRTEGGVKGEAAVPSIVPRVKTLLRSAP